MSRISLTAYQQLAALVGSTPQTEGVEIAVRGDAILLFRLVKGVNGEPERDDRLRLVALPGGRFRVDVRRHTGKWERTPFVGEIDEMFEEITGPMSHLLADT